jgi:hypothetical protein
MEFNEKEKASAVKQQALQALHDENVRLGLYDGVYAIDVLEQENRLLRARNERLETELTKTINEEYKMMKTQQEPVVVNMGTPVEKLYTTPQQRTWVGLTDEEILELFGVKGSADSDINPLRLLSDSRRIEAKLKEKNT